MGGEVVHFVDFDCQQQIKTKPEEPSTDIEEEANWDITLYPNPTDGNLNIYMDTPLEGDIVVEIYNTLGKQVHVYNMNNSTINTASLLDGIYILRVTNKGKTVSKSFIVIK
jgi:hypothetical protein